MVKVNNISISKTSDGERWIVSYPDRTFQSIVSIVPFRAVLRYVLDFLNPHFFYYENYPDPRTCKKTDTCLVQFSDFSDK